MRVVRTTLLSMVLVFGAAFLTEVSAQQTGTVTGQVTDESTAQPLTGVQIVVAGTNVGGLTDQNGRYLLTRVPAGEQQIRAVLIGYSQETRTVTVTAAGTATADFALQTSAVPLEALVVSAATGREQRARELGSKVSTIEVENLNQGPVTSMADAMGGRSSGLVLQDVNGTTGTSQRIRIRGANSLSLSNEPLIFVDGVKLNTSMSIPNYTGGQEPSRLNDLNPADIANIEIVKGPAASALYGTAAANGVILITTKRGRPGNTQWTAYAETGSIEDVTDYPANWLAYQANDPSQSVFDDRGFLNRSRPADGEPRFYDFCPNLSAALGECSQDGSASFNTLEDPRTRPYGVGHRQRYGASLRGGTENVRFFVSGQYEDEQGIVYFNTQDKLNFRGNLDARISEKADVSVSFGYTDANLALNPNDNHIFSPLLNGVLGYPNFIEADPDDPEFGDPNPSNYGFGVNLDQISVLPTRQDVDRYVTSVTTRYRPTTWLTLNATGGLDLASLHDYETLQPEGPLGWLTTSWQNGFRDSERGTDALYTVQGSAIGTFEVTPDLLSTTTVGTSYNLDHHEDTSCYGSSLVPGTASCGTTSALFSIDEDFFEIRTLGGYVNQDFAFRDRLFVSAGVRVDDNSAFGTEFELATYPSASVSWVVAEEQWFPRMDFLNTLRLRAAWGVAGLQPGFRDAVTLFAPITVASEAGDVPGVTLSVTGNELLKPERATEWEFGFDTGLFEDRLSLEFTYYNKKSEDALISRRLPGSLGLTTSVLANLGSIKNAGTEFGANLLIFESRDFGLQLGFTNTTLDNEVLDIGAREGVEPIVFGAQRHTEGFPAGAFFQPTLSWDDVNADGLLTRSEIEVGDTADYIGPSMPTWQRSVFADARLFDWLSVSTLVEGRGGHYTQNFTEAFRCGFRSTRGCRAVGDPDAPLDLQARHLAYRYGDADGDQTRTGYVERADFYRWREISATFSVPSAWTQRFQRAEGLRLTVAGRNLALWTGYSGIDPEVQSGGGNSNFGQAEFNTQPPVRYLMLRLDYTF
ncbi:MAG: SusC/RagA family TonB-linked outer membrane protein [Gemmatimonadetes bacterium]|nr:SusC/RagA family TonB-linked outer membrane protein [Gemmatimonadota bacterium]